VQALSSETPSSATGGTGEAAAPAGDAPVKAAPSARRLPPSAANVQVVAHRGGAAYAPENTTLAFLNGYRLGVDALELDVRINASGDFVVTHGDDLAQKTNCNLQVGQSESSALEGCDAAYHWTPAFRTDIAPGLLAGKGIGVPLLRSVLEAMELFTSPPATLWIELKNTSPYSTAVIRSTVTKFVELLSERLWRATIVLQSFDSYTLSQFKMRYSGSQTLLLWGPNKGSSYTCSAAVADATRRQLDILGIPPLQMSVEEAKECVTQAKQNGIRVALYTINREINFLPSLELEPDAVITDFPACLQSFLERPTPSNPYPAELASGALQPKCWR
jgi:glycerophosphoryl diester phosphodiesterase